MKSYIIKRFLIMIPTFFGITLVVFTIVNLAPMSERLSSRGGEGGEAQEGEGETSEALKYFRQEFHLDKPILLNTRFALSQEDIEELLLVDFYKYLPSAPVQNDKDTHTTQTNTGSASSQTGSGIHKIVSQASLPDRLGSLSYNFAIREKLEKLKEKKIKGSDRIKAKNELIDYGRDSVLHLFEIFKGAHQEVKERKSKLSPEIEKYIADRPSLFKDLTSWAVLTKDDDRAKSFTAEEIINFERYRFAKLWRYCVGRYLSINARKTSVSFDTSERSSRTEFLRKKNQAIFKENLLIKDKLTITRKLAEGEIEQLLKLWSNWIDKEHDDLEYSFFEKIGVFFLETRFAYFWGRILRLDFGVSMHTRKAVLPELVRRMQYSLALAVTSTFLAWMLSIPLGIYSAVKQNTIQDRILTVVLFILYSLPSFFVATVLLYYLATTQGWQEFAGTILSNPGKPPMPLGGFHSKFDEWITMNTLARTKDMIWHLTLPIICMTYASLAILSRYTRSGILDVIRSDYVRTARAKGLSERVVIYKHVVRNGIIPIITLLGQILPVIIGGSVVIEVIFGIDGMGKWMFDSIVNNDYNVVITVSMFSAILTLVGILISDLLYAVVDPRISFD